MNPSSRQCGMTLIELLVAIVLLSILVLGVSAMWAWAGNLVFEQTIRQKAVFALNAEMERLTALYRFTDFAASAPADESPTFYLSEAGGLAGLPTTRKRYQGTTALTPFVTADATTFLANPGTVYDATNGNAVILDLGRKVTARLSWTATAVDTGAYQCFGSTGSCFFVTAFLEYPYRLVDSTNNTADPFISAGPLQVISAMTVTGRYR